MDGVVVGGDGGKGMSEGLTLSGVATIFLPDDDARGGMSMSKMVISRSMFDVDELAVLSYRRYG